MPSLNFIKEAMVLGVVALQLLYELLQYGLVFLSNLVSHFTPSPLGLVDAGGVTLRDLLPRERKA